MFKYVAVAFLSIFAFEKANAQCSYAYNPCVYNNPVNSIVALPFVAATMPVLAASSIFSTLTYPSGYPDVSSGYMYANCCSGYGYSEPYLHAVYYRPSYHYGYVRPYYNYVRPYYRYGYVRPYHYGYRYVRPYYAYRHPYYHYGYRYGYVRPFYRYGYVRPYYHHVYRPFVGGRVFVRRWR
jgi:hypothetical protein